MMTDVMLEFIRRHARETGRFPTNREISEATDCPAWRVASVLGRLHANGKITRTQIAERGTARQAKYIYEVAA